MDTKQCVDYYEILEVHKNASAEIIEKAYKTLAKRYHPDINLSDKKAWAEEMFKTLNNAYETLSNPLKRFKYDSNLACTKMQHHSTKMYMIPSFYMLETVSRLYTSYHLYL